MNKTKEEKYRLFSPI